MATVALNFLLEVTNVFSSAILQSQSTAAAYLPILQNNYVFAASVASLIALPLMFFLFFENVSNAPPRMSVLFPALRGDFSLQKEGPIKAISEGFKKHGDCFRVRILKQGFTFLIGNDANAIMFDASDKDLTQREVYNFTVPVFGKNIVYDAPPSVMVQQLKFVRQGLTGNHMKEHAIKIVKETIDFFSKWPEQGEINLHKALSELTILTASRCLLGDEVREKMHDRVAELYQYLNDGMTQLSVFFPNLPTKAHRLRNNARDEMIKLFAPIIAGRRKLREEGKEPPNDYLQTLIDARYRDGTACTDREIVGLLIAALFAGQHTSSITSTWVGFMVLQPETKKKLLPRILEEQKRVLGEFDGELTFDGLAKMDLLHNCMKEVLRLFPPLVLLMRFVQEPQKYRNFTIPKGDIVVTCPPVSHRIPEVFTNPETYDPDRFSAERNEGAGKYDFIAFGGGRHACLGNNFAFLQIKTIWSVLFRNFDFEVVCPGTPVIDFTSIVAGPGNDTRVRFTRRKPPVC